MQNILSNTPMVDGQGNNDITGSWLGTSTWKYGRVYPDSKVWKNKRMIKTPKSSEFIKVMFYTTAFILILLNKSRNMLKMIYENFAMR